MEFLEVPLFDDDVYKLLVRLLLDLLVVCAVVFLCYRQGEKDDTYTFTFLLLNVMIFFICFALKKLELELGLALGLFAIFGIIRYRTESISVREMTYLFVVVGIAVINSLSNKKTSYVELAVTNAILIGASYVLERWFIVPTLMRKNQSNAADPSTNSAKALRRGMAKQSLVYDKLTLLGPARRSELVQDLEQRLGLTAADVDVGKIDLVKGSANLTVYFCDTDTSESGADANGENS